MALSIFLLGVINIRKIFKNIINIILILVIIVYMKPIIDIIQDSYQSHKAYKQAVREKEELMNSKKFDWITVKNTKVNYPVAWKERDNFYYLSHNIYDEESGHGAIFYEGSREPFSSHVTIVYGHCMRDKSMFATLHYLREDETKFKESDVLIERADGSIKKYKPLGLYVTNENFFYTNLCKMSLDEGIQTIQENSKYFIPTEYDENDELLVLMTCSYEHEGDRLFVFYISE